LLVYNGSEVLLGKSKQLTSPHNNITTPNNFSNTHYYPATHTDTMADAKFEGWLGKDKDSVKGKMEWGQFEPKKWTEDDVDIEISHCGICGSDLHMLSSGWGPTPYRT
jgi:hypothetical protein